MTKEPTGAGLHRNLISYLGFMVTAISAALILATVLWGLAMKQPSPYLGIFTYMIFPAVLGFGLLMTAYGMHRESLRRRRMHTTEALPYPRLDLNNPNHRRKFTYVLIGGTLLAILLGFVGYNAFIFTESVTFCGRLCHKVMEPEYAAYQHSPHAKVRCVDCHVGSGASFYVKSKLSGVRQVFAVLFHTYTTPIATPVKNLRPARETCEECHWPNKFYGAQLLQIPYFRFDEANTSDQISLLMKTGGGSARLGQSAGIHWHMVINNAITYATPDEKLQTIPWFKVRDASGQEREYNTLDHPLDPGEIAKLPRHTIDCMDCHNRPTHIYTPPDRAVDLAMNNGAIPRDLPWIKKTSTEAVMADYPDVDAARSGIQDRVLSFYAKNYPELSHKRDADIRSAVATLQGIYARSVFPKMKVDWKTYPDNIGPRNWPGCFRCHAGRHADKDGKVLTRECSACHTIPQRGPLETLGALPPVSDQSWHPMLLKGRHAEIMCNRCHSPGIRPSADCAACHKHPKDAPMADVDCTSCHKVPGQRKPQNDCHDCHDKPAGLHQKGGHPDAECTDCHKPHAWKVTGRDTCLNCHDDKKEHNAPGDCAGCHGFQ
jgi:hypothetical protein